MEYVANPLQGLFHYADQALVNYLELRDHSVTTATHLARVLSLLGDRQTRTVGLLCSSGPRFVLAWLALVRLGLSVLIIA